MTIQSLLETQKPHDRFPKTMSELRQKNKELQEECQTLHHKLRSLPEETEILQTQVRAFI